MKKNNKIIAEFMNFVFEKWKGKDRLGTDNTDIEYCYDEEGNVIDDLKFDSDWNWLMTVVEKIYQTNLYYDKYINFNSSMFTNGKIELSINIKDVYNQCVDFINFYNKQKEE